MKHIIKILTTLAILIFITAVSSAQISSINGIITEKNNLGEIKNVNVTAYDIVTNKAIANALSNNDGEFTLNVPAGLKYRLVAEKKSYFFREAEFLAEDDAKPLNIVMERKPGYTFDVSLSSTQPVNGAAKVENIKGARIEVYNNTTYKLELELIDHPISSFKFNFEEGNHYTVMVRKKGYLTKRIEAYINIDGCILCFDGMGMVKPNVVDVMTNDNQLGSFLGNMELEPVVINKTFKIENLYYDYDKSNIRPDAAKVLDNVLQVLKDNPAIQLEMGSHTDARGSDAYNMKLSNSRARSAVEYLVGRGIYQSNLTWKGYGESQLVNECGNGIKCPDDVHEQNRRTELKIVGISDDDPLDEKTLKNIKESEGSRSNTPFYGDAFND